MLGLQPSEGLTTAEQGLSVRVVRVVAQNEVQTLLREPKARLAVRLIQAHLSEA